MRFIFPEWNLEFDRLPKSDRRRLSQQVKETRDAWNHHNARIRPLLPSPLQTLLDTDLSDAEVRRILVYGDPGRLTLWLRNENVVPGESIRLCFQDILLTRRHRQQLRLIATDGAQIDQVEVDMDETDPEAIYIVRMSFHTRREIRRHGRRPYWHLILLKPEIELRFKSFEWEKQQKSVAALRRTPYRLMLNG